MSEMKLTFFISTLCLLAIASLWIGDLFESFDVDGEEEVVTLPAKNTEQQVDKDLLPSDRLIREDHHFFYPRRHSASRESSSRYNEVIS